MANRIMRWLAAGVLLALPWVTHSGAEQRPVGFLIGGGVIIASLLLYELAARRSDRFATRAGVGIAAAISFLLVWFNIVGGLAGEDNPANVGFFMLILAAAVGAFAARFRADGMARAMLGVAGAQVVLALLIATAPSTTDAYRFLLLNSFFVALWLISAACFWKAAREG